MHDGKRVSGAVVQRAPRPTASRLVWLIASGLVAVSASCAGDTSGADEAVPEGGGSAGSTELALGSDHPLGTHQRLLAVRGLADPDIVKENDNLFFLSGTLNGVELPFYESNDLRSFRWKRSYNPSAADPVYDYCL